VVLGAHQIGMSSLAGRRRGLISVMIAAGFAVGACASSGGSAASGPNASGSSTVTHSVEPVEPVEPVVATVPATSAQVVAADDAFAADLLPLLGGGNVVLSPFSITAALQMVLQGARGETAAQMRSVLHLASDASAADGAKQLAASLAGVAKPTQLGVADTIWLQQGLALQPDFQTTMSDDYAAGFQRADFVHAAGVATDDINKTIGDQTHGKITKLFPAGSLDASTRLVLANAVYLKAQWSEPFEASGTAPAPFQLSDGSSTSVPTMHVTGGFGYQKDAGYQAVTLPYSDGRLAMTIVLPDGSLATLEKSLTGASLAAMLKPGASQGLSLSLPKFSFSSSSSLGDSLQKLGMTDAFGSADFSGITTQQPLVISSVVHQAVIDVDEQGTEAAAATGVVMGAAAMMATTQVDIDRPFLFAITDTTTGAPLFLGTVANPAS
jgi:serpin B